MASISYPTDLSAPGPWLLDAESLRNLDKVTDSCVARMREVREDSLELAVSRKLAEDSIAELPAIEARKKRDELRQSIGESYPFNTERRRVILYMSGGRSAHGRSFEELMSLPHVNDEIPRGFALKVAIADAEIAVELGTSWYDRDLKVSVSAKKTDIAQELFGMLQNWVSDIQPRKWLQFWGKTRHVSFGFTILLVALLIVGSCALLIPQQGPSLSRRQAIELARQGVTPANEARAVQLILSMESGYEPTPPPLVRASNAQSWTYLILVAIVLWSLGSPPKGAIGIWAGKRAVERQRRWIQFVSATVPGIFVGSFFIPALLRLLGLSK